MFPKCYGCVTVFDVAQIVSVQKTDRGIVVCLLLKPNETSPALRTFATARRRSTIRRLPATLETLQTALSAGLESPPPSSPEVIGSQELSSRETAFSETGDRPSTIRPRFPSEAGFDDTFVERVRALLPTRGAGRLMGASVAALSRGFARAFNLPLPTVSETMAAVGGRSTEEVHFDLATAHLGVPFLGGSLEGALRQDLLNALDNKDVRALKGIRGILESTPQLTPGGGKKRDSLDRLAKQFIERLEPD